MTTVGIVIKHSPEIVISVASIRIDVDTNLCLFVPVDHGMPRGVYCHQLTDHRPSFGVNGLPYFYNNEANFTCDLP